MKSNSNESKILKITILSTILAVTTFIVANIYIFTEQKFLNTKSEKMANGLIFSLKNEITHLTSTLKILGSTLNSINKNICFNKQSFNFDNKINDVVIKLDGDFKTFEVNNEYIKVGAAVSLLCLAKETLSLGFGGLETIGSVPGTVGGAAIMNAGVRYFDFSTSKGSEKA